MPNKSNKLKELGIFEQFLSKGIYYSADEVIAVLQNLKKEFDNVTITLEPYSCGEYIIVYGEPKDE